VIVTGPYIDVKGSQSQPHCVSIYEPGRMSEIHRFPTPEKAAEFADQQRAAHNIDKE
jgi:hypothetical protein